MQIKNLSVYVSQQWCEGFWSCLLINVNTLLNWVLLRAQEKLERGKLDQFCVISVSNFAMGELKRH